LALNLHFPDDTGLSICSIAHQLGEIGSPTIYLLKSYPSSIETLAIRLWIVSW
jgi:hypothetical protein